ncbi:MAG: EAL domain-containing protein [Lysobacteraceae bacterium]
MSSKDSVIRLVFVTDRLDDAEQMISQLRNGGMAVRPQRPESLDELKHILSASGTDLVLADHRATTLPFDAVAAAVAGSGKDISLVAAMSTLSEADYLAVLDQGARAVALTGQPRQLQFVVRSEFESLNDRRGLRRLESALRETERRCDALITSSREPIAYLHEGMHIRANEAYLEMFGYESFDDVEGLSVLDMIAPAHTDGFKQLLKRLGKGEQPPKSLELVAQRGDGTSFDAVMEFTQASWEGEPCLQVVFRQQLLDADVARELDELRQRDQATGLFNRQHFMGELESAVSAAAGGRGDQALLLVAPDNYAALLGDIGMAHADDLLRGIGARIGASLPGDAVVARFSDHGFGVLLAGCDHARSQAMAQAVVDGFREHIIEAGDRSLNLTVSIGGVQIGEKIASVQQILARAGQCQQSSQSVGGNHAEVFDPAARDRAEEERIRGWVARIKQSLDEGGFLLHYQPMVSLQGEPGEHYEAFLRMRVGGGEVMAPLSFLPIAEEHGLLLDIDRWVVGRAIEVLGERRKAGHDTTLFVKLSPASLTEGQEALAGFVAAQLAEHGVEGRQLVVELPETKVFTNLKAAQDLQQRLARHGCRVALEQFGSGLNSFQLLTHFEPSYLKIDRSFMDDLSHNPDNQQRIREIAGKAREAGKQTIAEFVQDAASMSVLFSCGVDFVEGHFLAAAGPEMNYEFG